MDARYSPSFFTPSTKTLFCIAAFTSLSVAFQMFSGIPTQGQDICYGDLKCIQGFIKDDSTAVYQFNRLVESVRAASDGTLQQLHNCMTLQKIGELLLSAFGQGNSNGSVVLDCSVTSPEFQNAHATSYIYEIARSNFSKIICDTYYASFAAATLSCADGGMAFAYDLAVAAAIFGGIIAVALCIWGVCKINTCANEQSFDCCEKKEKGEEKAVDAPDTSDAPAPANASPV